MARISCDVRLDQSGGPGRDSVCVECDRCQHEVSEPVHVNEDNAIRAAFARIRDECPRGESNFYYDGGEE